MSESSSAVLDLEGDDGEVAAAIDNGQDVPAPLIMEHGYDIAVKVDSPLKQLSTLETYVTYRVRCVCARWSTPPAVRRRYNHFKVLHKRLSSNHPLVAAPPLPPLHTARQQLDRYESGFVALRAQALDAFLNRVAKHPILTHSEDFRLFLTTPDEDLDKIFKNENSAMNLWGLSGALYGSGESKPANGARVKDPEFTSLTEYLQSLQQKLNTLNTLSTKLYKGSAALGTELMGMNAACSSWASGGGAPARAAAGVARATAAAAAPRHAKVGKHNAVLPMLSAYAAAQVEKIKQRDSLHATYVAGTNTSDDLHNRLEQASEALRSDLADWQTKTRSELKQLLIELAERQINIYQQSLYGWETALKMSDGNMNEVFKTVSKNAIQNLSPSKSKDMESIDFDDLEIELDSESSRQNGTDSSGEKVESNSEKVELSSEIVESKSEVELKSENVESKREVELKSENVESKSEVEAEVHSAMNVDATNVETDPASATSEVTDPLQGFAEVNLDS